MKRDSKLYKSHRIELQGNKSGISLFIDDRKMRYGQLSDGLYYLEEYAYDWSDSLEELARKYVDYLERARKARTEPAARAKRGR